MLAAAVPSTASLLKESHSKSDAAYAARTS
jgi:hypothetical protein